MLFRIYKESIMGICESDDYAESSGKNKPRKN